MADSYQILIGKLDEFIRKYYKNQLIRGAIYFFSVALIFYISLTLLEYFGHLGIGARTVLFYSYILVNLSILTWFFCIPLLKIYKIGKLISHEQAAQIIGKHFHDVRDKLLNTLQLKQLGDENPENAGLIRASIDQRIIQLKPVPFVLAIDLKKNRKYSKYAALPLLLIVLLLFAAPSLITGPTERLIHHNTFYEKQAPFSFVILNDKLESVQQEDFLLNVKMKGEEIPENAFIEVDKVRYQLIKDNTVNFHYNLKNLQKDTKFQLYADGFYSKEYEITVLPKPIILNFDVALKYPAYVGKTNESLSNTGDLLVPEGTEIDWHFLTKDTRNIVLRFKDRKANVDSKTGNSYSYASTFNTTQNYTILPGNEHFANKDSLVYTINVIPDIYPTIKVTELRDSVYENQCYFKGMIKDDYGFTRLNFVYRNVTNGDSGTIKTSESKLVSINNSLNQQEFYYFFDFSTIAKDLGDEFEYYFEVWDNDGVNGAKATRTQKMVYKLPTAEELKEKNEKSNEQIKNDLDKSIAEAKQFQKDIDEINKKLIDKKNVTWQDKKQLQDLINKQLNLQDKIENIQKENIEKNNREKLMQKDNEDLLKKQEELEKLFNEIMTPEMKELFKKLQDMLDKMDKDKIAEMLDKMKMSNKDMEKQLDRNLELFKQLQFEKKLQETIDKIAKLAEKQEDLSKKTEKTDKDTKNNDSLSKGQKDLNKEFDQIKKDLDDVAKQNKELEKPNKLDSTNKEENSIKDDMENSLDKLNNKENSKASKSQKSAAKKMKELSDKLAAMKEEMDQEGLAEDIDALREILENLLRASFSQEDLMTQLDEVKTTDPKYVKIMQDQKNLKDDLKMIEDSLFALSKRQSQIESFVNQEIADINDNVDKAITYLNARNVASGKAKQQYSMTAINDLALMLAETLNNMQQQQSKPSTGSCKKPGNCKKPGGSGKKPSFKSLKQMQQELNKGIEALKNGQKPGQKSMSEQLARLAAQQEAIRKQLQELMDALKKEGDTKTGSMNDVKSKMEQTEKDLVNKVIDPETLKRQQEILTRLLESEKAENERELDEKRESNEGKNDIFSNPSKILEYKSIKSKEVELLKTIPPSLKTFYKNKVNEYFYNFGD